MNKFCTVITNFSRLDRLRGCLESLELHKGVMDVAVATFGGSPQHRKLLKEMLPAGSEVFVTHKDYGCNQLWIKALELAKTRWVSILHDDDHRPPGFAETANQLIKRAELEGCGFIAWDGAKLDHKTGAVSGRVTVADVPEGVWDTDVLRAGQKQQGNLALSPVSFIFDRETALDALYWAEENLSDCVTRPSMMVGNDVALLWAHIVRYPKFLKSSKQLSLYGHWEGSETCQWASGGNPKLMECYNKTRARLPDAIPVRANAASRAIKRRFVQVWSDYLSKPCDAESERRNAFARQTWSKVHESGNWINHRITSVQRTSDKTIGDQRDIPYVKDMIQQGCDLAEESDVIVLINADICMSPTIEHEINEAVSRVGACHATRWNFERGQMRPTMTEKEIKKGVWYAGTDLVAFTKKWWLENGHEFPDMLLACECWDLVMRNLINIKGGVSLEAVIYHEIHQAWWYIKHNYVNNPGNKYNRDLSIRWFIANRKHGADDKDWEKEIERRHGSLTRNPFNQPKPDFEIDPRTGRVKFNRWVPLSQRMVNLNSR